MFAQLILAAVALLGIEPTAKANDPAEIGRLADLLGKLDPSVLPSEDRVGSPSACRTCGVRARPVRGETAAAAARLPSCRRVS